MHLTHPPVKGFPFGTEKPEWWVYLMVKKIEDMFSGVDRIPACDRQTYRRTDRHLATAQFALCIRIAR